jgi:thiol:disulfide interchange protein DsbG
MALKLFSKAALLATTIGMIAGTSAVYAQEENTLLPNLPDPIQNLVNEGAQIRFLGKDAGLEAWIAIKNGQEQYFYVMPNGAFLTGLLFDEKGNAITIEQVRRLREQGDGKFLDLLASDKPENVTKSDVDKRYEFKTPSEQLYSDIENSNWVPIGQAGTPLLYSFIDPQCPHCHEAMKNLRPYIEAGKVQVRMIPVGFKDATKAQAAFLMATPGPEEVWWEHIDGNPNALPAKAAINSQGVERNLAIMQSWKLNVTPLIIYRGVDEKVKIIRGKPQDIEALISDLGTRT